jgi:YbbR domain-containing protein
MIPVKVTFSRDAPAGLRYETPTLRPAMIMISGREDLVNRAAQAVVAATPTEPKSSIDGDFAVSIVDADNNPIDGLQMKPDTVHVTVSLQAEPYTKIVAISPQITELPLPPYSIGEVIVQPVQARISGSPENINQISIIETEEISARDLIENKTLDVKLVPLPGVTIRDSRDRPLTRVSVQIMIRKPIVPQGGGAAPPP